MAAVEEMRESGAIPMRVYGVLLCAVATISAAGVIVAAVQGIAPERIAFLRMAGASLLLAPVIHRISRPDFFKALLGGLLLAAHFSFWFASLQLIPVMRSTLLVTMAPIWAGLMEWGVLRKPPKGHFWSGIGIALPGLAVMSGFGGAGGNLEGDFLALFGGVMGAGYFFIGSVVRPRLATTCYSGITCAVAALCLLPLAIFGEPFLGAISAHTWMLLALLVMGPQLIGHNGLNYCLRYIPASTVTAGILLEPVGAAVLALIFLDQVPVLTDMMGGCLVLLGLYGAIKQPKIPG